MATLEQVIKDAHTLPPDEKRNGFADAVEGSFRSFDNDAAHTLEHFLSSFAHSL